MSYLPRGRLGLVLLFAFALAAMVALPAAATLPGSNGQIGFDQCNAVCNGTAIPGAYLANPDGSGEHLLVANSCCPGWSPDGSKVAIPYGTTDGRIGCAIVNADGSGYKPFAIPDPTLNVGCGTTSWSPDGKRLASESWDDSNPARNGIYTISSTNGRGLTRITANPYGTTNSHDLAQSWSPDGKQLVFIRNDANGNSVGLFVVTISNGQVREILADTRLNPSDDWSPHGNLIIFSRHVTPAAKGSIWVINSDGSGLREIQIPELPCGGAFANPSAYGCHATGWSPDGTKIVFIAGSAATGANVYTANADGTGLTQVTHDGDDDDTSWGPHTPTG
jgi:Tol biopolymer transport system component